MNIYLSKQALDNLKYYKYGAIDKSPLSKYILQPYWNWSLQFFPMWMAPNLITLVGLSFVAINVVFTIIWIPDLVGPGDSWIYLSFCAGIWLYSTFDNVDGKQARRTNSSSPLGELFDHGCDALNCSFGAVIQCAALASGYSLKSFYVAFLAICAFYFSTWEEYYTGVLYLGYVNGPTEGLVISCLTMILSSFYGPHIWKLPASFLVPGALTPSFNSIVPVWVKIFDLMAFGMTFLLIFLHIPFSIYNVYKACHRKQISFVRALTGIVPILVYFSSWYLWSVAPETTIADQHCILFILFAGVLFAHIATNIILAYVTRMDYPYSFAVLIPMLLGSLLANSNALIGIKIMSTQLEFIYLAVACAFAVISYLRWVLLIIDKFCAHLKIKCLSITNSVAVKNS